MDISKTIQQVTDELNRVDCTSFQHVTEREATLSVFFSRCRLSETGCWIWTASVDKRGYGYFKAIGGRKGSGRGDLAHRLSHELFKGPIGEGLFVLHSCDMPAYVNPDHLRVGTQKENMADCISRGRFRPGGSKCGSENQLSKLNDDDVVEIRSSPLSAIDLAKRYGIDRTNVYAIINGKTWTHVPMPAPQENVDAR
jgi:HNH endonuclease